MNYISIHITSYFQETIKEHQIVLISLLALLLCIVGCNETEPVKIIPNNHISKEDLSLHPNEGKWYYRDKPFSGFAIVCHKNGTLYEKVGYYNGKKEGEAKKWYSDGSLLKNATYTQNRLHGKVTLWWQNGLLRGDSNFVDGTKHGIQKKWYINGQIASQTSSNLGKSVGLQQAWLENGKLYANYEVKNGRIFGLKRANLCYQLNNENIQYKSF